MWIPLIEAMRRFSVSHALRHKHVTYFNITPDRSTLPILEAQGYVRYCTGRFVCRPIAFDVVAGRSGGSRSRQTRAPARIYRLAEIDLLMKHAAYGCISVICTSANGRHPFVFQPRLQGRRDALRLSRLLSPAGRFCSFGRPVGTISRMSRVSPLVVVDADGPIKGLIGWYSDGGPKVFQGTGPTASRRHCIFGTGHVSVFERLVSPPTGSALGPLDPASVRWTESAARCARDGGQFSNRIGFALRS